MPEGVVYMCTLTKESAARTTERHVDHEQLFCASQLPIPQQTQHSMGAASKSEFRSTTSLCAYQDIDGWHIWELCGYRSRLRHQ